jgi:hypothetical protein
MNRKLVKFGIIGIIIIAIILLFWRPVYENYVASSYEKPTFVPYADQKIFTSYSWPLFNTEGNALNLKKYKDKVMMVVFVSTQSKESLYQLRTLKKIYDDYKTKMEFVFVSNDSHANIKNYLINNKYYFPLYVYLDDIPTNFSDTKLPQTYVISNKGRIAVDFSGPANWDTIEFRNLLDGLIKK